MVIEESGGINVPINVTLDPKALNSLERSLNIIIGQLEQFREASASLNKERAKGATQATKRAAALKKEADKLGITVRALKTAKEATRQRGEELKKFNIEQKKAENAAASRFNIERRTISLEVAKLRAIKKVTKAIDARVVSEAAVAEAKRKGLVLTSEEIRKLGILDVVLKEQTIARENLEKQKRLRSDAGTRKVRAETKALKLQNIELDKIALAQAQKTLGTFVPPTGTGRGKNDAFNKSLEKTDSLGNRISFTFRRLFGILAAFTIARKLVEGFVGAIRTAIQFNAKLEEAELGLASLFLAAGRVTDAIGETASGARGLALATGVAREQIQQLRIDALATSATFEELLSAFQTAVAPGIQAGLGIDQIREFAVSISKAATALGVPQQQLAEEIRSVLQGTIRVRDTRIAVALGISNTDIRRAKELGVLAEFLEDRFSAFAFAGVEAQKNFNVLFTNTRDALIQLSALTGEGFFLELKDLLRDVKDEVIELSEATGDLEFQPGAVQVAESFFLVLKSAVEQVRQLQQGLSATDLSIIGDTLGQALTTSFVALRIGIEIFVEAVSKAASILGLIFDIIGRIGNEFKGLNISSIVRDIVVWSIAFKAIAISATVISKSMKAIFFIIPGIRLAFAAIAITVAKIASIFVRSTGFLAGIKLMETSFVAAAGGAALLAGEVLIIAGALIVAIGLITALKRRFIDLDPVTQLRQIELEIDRLQKLLRNPLVQATGESNAVEQALDKKIEELVAIENKIREAGFDPETAEALDFKKTLGKEITDLATETGEALSNTFTKFRNFISLGSKEIEEPVRSLEEAFDNLPAVISQGTQALTTQKAIIEQLRNASLESANAFAASKDSILASSNVAAQRLEIAKAETEIELKTRELRAQATVAENAISEAARQQLRVRQELQTLNLLELQASERIKGGLALQLGLEQKREQIKKRESLLVAQITKAKREERVSEIDALEKKLATTRDQILKAEDLIALNRQRIEQAVIALVGEDVETIDRIIILTTNLLKAQAIQAANKEQIAAIDETILELEKEILNITRDRISLVAIESKIASEDAIKDLRIQIELQRKLTQAQSIFSINNRATELAQAQATVKQDQKSLDLIERQGREDLRNLQISIDKLAPGEAQNDLIDQRISKEREVSNQIELQNARLEESKQSLEELNQIINSGFVTGLKVAFTNFANEALDSFTTTVELMKGILDGFVRVSADAVTSIFDPKNSQSAKQRFGQFLLQIANQIIAMLIKVALVRAALGLSSLFGATGPNHGFGSNLDLPAVGDLRKKGGQIGKGGAPGWGHFSNPKGAALGGGIGAGLSKPKGVDTSPIWAQPGEFMMRLSAVRKYGSDVMSAINTGLIDPSALRALSASRKLSRHMSGSRSPYFAHGGLIGDQPAPSISGGDERAAAPAISFLIASEEQLDTLLAGGNGAMFRWLGDNSDAVRGILS